MNWPRILTTLAAAMLSPAFAWLAGYNFDTRGFGAALIAACALFFAAWMWTYPGWDE
jgi:uncharacterized membrane protein YvlD (DUF360 family)